MMGSESLVRKSLTVLTTPIIATGTSRQPPLPPPHTLTPYPLHGSQMTSKYPSSNHTNTAVPVSKLIDQTNLFHLCLDLAQENLLVRRRRPDDWLKGVEGHLVDAGSVAGKLERVYGLGCVAGRLERVEG